MAVRQSTEAGQIPFSQELLRKGTHMGGLCIPAAYHFLSLSKTEALYALIPAALLMIAIDVARLRDRGFWRKIAAPLAGRMVRGHEVSGDFTGATYILISICLTIGLYEKYLAIAAICFIIVGDTFAALIGRKLGRHRFGRKSVEGSLGCLLGTVIVALLVPNLPLAVGLTGAVAATVTEALSTNIDDNISVPIVSGLVMTLLTSILAAT
jgi:dolichol kinase